MNFRMRVAAWFSLSILALTCALIFTAHLHLDEELRKDRWDRSHPNFPGWVIHGSYTDEEVRDILSELMHVWLLVGIPMVLASLAAGYFIAQRSVRPVRRINCELAALGPESIERGVRLPDKDPELATLVGNINNLLGRVGRSYKEIAEFSSRVAHELRTPLTLLRMQIEAAAPELPPEFSEELQEQVRRLSNLVERALLAANAEGGKLDIQMCATDLSELINELREGYTSLAEVQSMQLDWRVEPEAHGVCDPGYFRQILHNLLGNALRHGVREARVRLIQRPRSGRVVFCLSNFLGPALGTHSCGGAGIGLRLVRSLAAALPGLSFQVRQTGTVFATRLVIQTPTGSPAPSISRSSNPS